MNKVTQAIYQKKVENLEEDVKDIKSKDPCYIYLLKFSGSEYNCSGYIYANKEINNTPQEIFDYIFENTDYYNWIPMSGWYHNVSESNYYRSVFRCGKSLNYPGATTTEISIMYIDANGTSVSSKKFTRDTITSSLSIILVRKIG